jgi:muramoyltetrapeptide carboxypeptidase
VAIVAPAGQFSAERLVAGTEQLRQWGLEPSFSRHLFAQDLYFAGTPAQRLSDLQEALADPHIDAVWAARGGYGCAHLLPQLKLEACPPKLIIGFSDLTALLNPLRQAGWLRRGGALVHGPVVQTLAAGPEQGSDNPVLVDAESRKAMQLLLNGQPQALRTRQCAGPVAAVRGPLVGGNLSVLASLAGTPWQLKSRGAIVLLEEVGEAPYRIDRLITQLIQSGSLRGAKAVAVGQLIASQAIDSQGRSYTGGDLLLKRLEPLGIPVFMDLEFGHGARNLPWLLGAQAKLAGGQLALQ